MTSPRAKTWGRIGQTPVVRVRAGAPGGCRSRRVPTSRVRGLRRHRPSRVPSHRCRPPRPRPRRDRRRLHHQHGPDTGTRISRSGCLRRLPAAPCRNHPIPAGPRGWSFRQLSLTWPHPRSEPHLQRRAAARVLSTRCQRAYRSTTWPAGGGTGSLTEARPGQVQLAADTRLPVPEPGRPRLLPPRSRSIRPAEPSSPPWWEPPPASQTRRFSPVERFRNRWIRWAWLLCCTRHVSLTTKQKVLSLLSAATCAARRCPPGGLGPPG